MPWTKESPPDVAKSWSDAQRSKCVAAGNAALRGGASDADAIFACIHAAGMSNMERVARFAQDEPFDVEILRAGTWYGNGCPKDGCKFGVDDLHDMVTNFNAIKDEHSVVLKRGHSTDVGDIALGWVDSLWVEGDRLLGRFVSVPKVVREAINKKLFRKVSIEAMRNVVFAGKKLKGWVLDAVALLGAEIPAVSGLKDLGTYLASRSLEHGAVATFTIDVNDDEQEHTMDEETKKRLDALDAKLAVSDDKIKLVTAENETLKAANAKLTKEAADRVTVERKTKIDFNRAKVTGILEQAVKDRLILPAQRETFSKLLKTTDDEAMFTVSVEDVEKLIKDGGKKTSFNREDSRGKGASGDSKDRVHEDAGEELNRLALERIDQNPKMPYMRALELTMQSNPDLAREHIGGTAEEAA